MNNIGWLFVFMNKFENEFNSTEPPKKFESSDRPLMCAVPDDHSGAEQIALVRSFFELLATWDEEG
jgi:hypothetical protein